MKKYIWLVVVCMGVLLSPVMGYGGEKIVARVNGSPITEKDLWIAVQKKLPMISFHRNVSREKVDAIKKEVLQDLINDELIYQDARRRKISVSEDEVDKQMRKVRRRFSSDSEYEKAIKSANTTVEALRDRYRRELIIKKMKEMMIYSKATVSESEARDYYVKNKERYFAPESLKLWEIFISVPANATPGERKDKRKKAEEILARIRNGEDFASLAWNYSDDRYKYKSGELGFVHRNRLSPEVARALKDVKPGEVTDVIETIYGYYIFKVEDIRPPQQLPFEKVRDRIMKELTEKKRKKLWDDYIRRLREKAEIETNM